MRQAAFALLCVLWGGSPSLAKYMQLSVMLRRAHLQQNLTISARPQDAGGRPAHDAVVNYSRHFLKLQDVPLVNSESVMILQQSLFWGTRKAVRPVVHANVTFQRQSENLSESRSSCSRRSAARYPVHGQARVHFSALHRCVVLLNLSTRGALVAPVPMDDMEGFVPGARCYTRRGACDSLKCISIDFPRDFSSRPASILN